MDGSAACSSASVWTARADTFVQEYSVDPAWSPDGDFVVYSGADIGTTFPVKAAGRRRPARIDFPSLTLTRGARRLRFFPGRRSLVVLRGEMQHKNLWLVDLDTGAERQLTKLASDFDVRDFDISSDGREIVSSACKNARTSC